MIKKRVSNSKNGVACETPETKEEAVCGYGGDGLQEGVGDVLSGGAACEGGAVGCCSAPRAVTKGKKFHGERLKLLVEVCEKWSLFRQPWNTGFVRDAHALIDLGLLKYVCADNGYIRVQPTDEGMGKYMTIVAGVFGDEVKVSMA